MSTLFVGIEIVLAIVIVAVVLLQKSSSLGLGVYSGSNESLFGAKGPASFLAKATMALALIFLANTIFLGYQFNAQQQKSVFDKDHLKPSTQPLNAPLNAQGTTGSGNGLGTGSFNGSLNSTLNNTTPLNTPLEQSPKGDELDSATSTTNP